MSVPANATAPAAVDAAWSLVDFSGTPRLGWLAYAFITAVLLRWISTSQSRPKYPPGPKGLPLVGNLFQLTGDAWYLFTEWKNTYGPVVYLNLAGTPVVVLNTLDAAGDLLDRRASIYSDRPHFIVACDMLTDGLFFTFTGYGNLWRRMRRAAHEALHMGLVKDYFPIQTLEATILVKDMLATPKNWESHLRRTVGSTVLSVTYDTPPLKDAQDPAMAKIFEFTKRIVRAAYVDGSMVEFFPFLKHVPAKFAAWKREALKSGPEYSKLFEGLYSTVKARVDDGDTRPSFSASMVEKQVKYNLTDKETSWLIATVAAGSETMAGVLAWCMLAMVMYPDVQRKVHEEIDRVVGRGRMPSFDDMEEMVYVRALVKEILRWHPVDPLGMQHRSIEDDVYEGHFIPKGTIIIPNVWAINRDPDLWGADADHVRPERHIGPDGQLVRSPLDTKDEGHVTFGFGRRICVGRHLARNSLFLNIASMLWMFEVRAPLGPDGKEIHCVDDSINQGLVVRPLAYDHQFIVRHPDAVSIFEAHKELLNVD